MTNVATAITAIVDLLEVASTLTFHATQLQRLTAAAQAEGRDLTDEELAQARSLDDSARSALARAIEDKRIAFAGTPTKAWDTPVPAAPGAPA